MVIWGLVVFVTGYRVSEAVVGYVYHQIKITSADRFLNNSFCFTGTKTGNLCSYQERFLLIALECNVILVLVGAFFPPLHQIIIDLITQLFTTGKRNDAKVSYRDRFKKSFTALLNLFMPSNMYINNRIFRACLMNSSEYVNTYIDLLQWL